MERFLNHTKQIIFHKQKDILSSVIVLSSMSIVARVFGILRFRTLTFFFDEKQIDLLLAAFRLPDFIFEILITGVLSAAFIPLFIKYEKDQEKLHENISSIVNFIFIALSIFIVILFVAGDVIFPFITPGFYGEEINIVVSLSRILLVTQLPFLVVGSIVSGMAQANKIFIITALAQALYSVGAIVGTLIFSQSAGIAGPIIGVIMGAALFLAIQFPTLFIIKFNYKLLAHKLSVMREFIQLFIPRVLSVLATQVDFTVDLALSSLLSRGSYTAFFFAQRLQFVPVSFLGIAFGQASLPYLSDIFRSEKLIEFKKLFIDSILQLLFLTTPLAFFFVFARTPIIRIFFGGPRLSIESTSLTALTLSYFALSIPLHTIYYFVVRAYYATYDTKIPFFVSTFSSVVNVSFSLFFIFVLRQNVAFLALAFSIAITLNVSLLLVLFYRKIGGFDVFKLIKNTIKIYTSAFFSSLISYPLMKLLDTLILNTTRTFHVFLLLIITFVIFGLSYLFFAWLLTIEEIYILGQLLVRIKQMKKKITEVYTDVG